MTSWKSLEGLSTRSKNIITNMWDDLKLPHPIRPIDIAGYSEAEWLRQPNAGKKTVIDINQWLAGYGLQIWTGEAQYAQDVEAYERAELARLKAKYEAAE